MTFIRCENFIFSRASGKSSQKEFISCILGENEIKCGGKGKNSCLQCRGILINTWFFAYLMRRIGSAEVTGPIPVSSFIEISKKARKFKVCVLFFCFPRSQIMEKITGIFHIFVGENGGKRGGKILEDFQTVSRRFS